MGEMGQERARLIPKMPCNQPKCLKIEQQVMAAGLGGTVFQQSVKAADADEIWQ